jgi:hypothetical protein
MRGRKRAARYISPRYIEHNAILGDYGVAQKGISMPKIAFLFFLVLCFGPPFFVRLGLLAPLIWSAAMAIFAVATGWRAPPEKGVFASALIGMSFATVVNVPIYFVSRLMG